MQDVGKATTVNDTISESDVNENLHTHRGSLLSLSAENKIENFRKEVELANKIMDLEKQENDKIGYILEKAEQRFEIRTDFEHKFNQFRLYNEKVALISKENKFSDRTEKYLHRILDKSKHRDGLELYFSKKREAKLLREQLLKGELDPNTENLDMKIQNISIEYTDPFRIIESQILVNSREKLILPKKIDKLTTTNFEQEHQVIPEKVEENRFHNVFPFYKKSEGIAGKITKKHLGLDDNIKIADDLFSIQDSGDYELDYGIRDKTKYLSKFISYNSIIDNNNFLYNSVSYSNFKDLSRYARERVKQSINLKGKENTFDVFEEAEDKLDENLDLDFEWKDLLLEPEKNLDKRLKSLRFDDLINIVSGKISDLELHHKLNDKRPIKTAKEMDDFLMDLALEAEIKKDRRIKEKE